LFFLFLASSCLYFQSPLPLYLLSFPFYVLLWRYVGCSIKFYALVCSKFMFLVSVTPKIHNLHFMSFKVGLDQMAVEELVMLCSQFTTRLYSHTVCYYPKAGPCKEPSRYSALSPALDFP
jgi:hypothetical protein